MNRHDTDALLHNTSVSNKPLLYREEDGLNDAMNMGLLQKAFDWAEQETSNYYEGRSCGLKDIEDKHSCPICYFRIKVKEYINKYNSPHPR